MLKANDIKSLCK